MALFGPPLPASVKHGFAKCIRRKRENALRNARLNAVRRGKPCYGGISPVSVSPASFSSARRQFSPFLALRRGRRRTRGRRTETNFNVRARACLCTDLHDLSPMSFGPSKRYNLHDIRARERKRVSSGSFCVAPPDRLYPSPLPPDRAHAPFIPPVTTAATAAFLIPLADPPLPRPDFRRRFPRRL